MGTSEYRSFFLVVFLCKQLYFTKSSVNLALNKTTSQSSNYSTSFLSSNAVDGIIKSCSNYGFAHTLNSEREWWQVDLGDVYEIKMIHMYYRKYFLNRLDGYSINIIKSLNPLDSWQCHKDTDNMLPTNSTLTHICQSLGRFVKFYREKTTADNHGDKAVINLCELEVYGCPQGRYGNNMCNLTCGVGCLNSRCDPDNGHCNCSIGWAGVNCNVSQCKPGQYVNGGNCIYCPLECTNKTCNAVNGECLYGCEPSFYGALCNLTCPEKCNNSLCGRSTGECLGCKSGFYGETCKKACQWNCKAKECIQDSGNCSSCNPPFKGNKCTECVDGFYGKTCTKCSEGCTNGICNQMDGKCTCNLSYFGYICNQSCSTNCKHPRCNKTNGDCLNGCKTPSFIGKKCDDCSKGFYGELCNLTCNENCEDCDRYTGDCSSCKPGKESNEQCSRSPVDNEGSEHKQNSTGPIIGGSVAAIVVVLIAVVILLILKRRKSKEGNKYENQITIGLHKTDNSIRDTADIEQQQTADYETLGLENVYVKTYCDGTYTGLNFTEVRLSSNENT